MNPKSLFLTWFVLGIACTPKPVALRNDNPENILLKDFRPVSIYHVPQTRMDKSMFPAIDMHAHPYPKNPDELDAWVRNMDSAGISRSIVLTYAHGKSFDSLVSVFSKYPNRFDLWCGIDYTGYDQPGFQEKSVAELERCHQVGAKGVGEEGDKGKGLFYSKPSAWGMHSDDARMDAVFEKCADLHMPVNIHVADPKWMYEKMDSTNDGLMNAWTWKVNLDSGVEDHAGMIRILENTVKKHPRTTFIACHLANCCYDLSIIGKLLDTYPNLNIDIAARYAELAPIPRAAKEFITHYQDRILYGTDMGTDLDMYRITFRILETADEHFYDHERFSYHWPLYGLDLPEAVLKKVYHDNAARMTGGS
jgi:predicted TIM-barrel fold metal-dependent hydrolase